MRIALLFSTLLFLFSPGLFANTAANSPPIDSVIPIDKSIRQGTLNNGLTYYIKKNSKPEKRMELRLIVKAGAINEDDDQNGIAHFVEHMLFNGTEHFPKNTLIHDLEKIGVRFGADLNAYTTDDHTSYQLPIATDKPELINLGFKILADWAGRATFNPKEIDKERGVVLEEWRANQGAEMRADKAHRSTLYYGSKLIKHDVVGDATIIQKAPYKTIQRFYKEWYRPDLMAVIVVGDFNVDEIEKLIQTYFSYLKKVAKPRQLAEDTIDIKSNQSPLVSIYTDKEQTYPHLSILYKKLAENPETFQHFRNQFIHQMISNMMGERITDLIQQANPPLQMAGIGYGRFFHKTDIARFFIIPINKNFMRSYETFLTEVFRAIEWGFTETEYQRAKASLLTELEAAYNNRDKTESSNFAYEYSDHFVHHNPVPGIEYKFHQSQQLAQTVGLNEINQNFKRYITEDNQVILATAAKKTGIVLPNKTQLLTTYQTFKHQHYTAFKDKFADKPLFSKKLMPGKINKTTEIKRLGITEFLLSNGIKVVVKPTHFNEREILLHAFSRGGSSLVAEKDYFNAENAADIINEAGIANFNKTTLEKLLAGKSIYISPYISSLTEGLNGQSTPKDVETLFQLLHLYFTEPRKDKEAFAAFIAHQKQWIDDFKRSPSSEFYDITNYIMSGNDPRSKPVTKEMIGGLNLDKAFKLYQQRFADPSDFTFIFVGNMEMEKFKTYLTQYLASLPTKGGVEDFKNVYHDSPKKALAKNFYKGKENKAMVKLIVNGDFAYNRQAIYISESLVDILNYRLTDKIREEESAVYSIDASFSPQHYPKSEYQLEIQFQCDPNKVTHLISDIKTILQGLKSTLPTDEEMQKVSEANKRQYEINLKENMYWRGEIRKAYYHHLDINAVLHYPELIKQLRKEDIKKAANDYIRFASLKTFVLYPEKKKRLN